MAEKTKRGSSGSAKAGRVAAARPASERVPADGPYDGPPAAGIEVRPSRIDGLGCFATAPFRKGRKIAELVGERVSRVEAARRMRGRRRLHICGIDSYWGIDGSRGGNGSQFINHSCRPNSFVRIVRGHIIFFALRDIAPGDEITLDYVDSYHPDDYRCRCGVEGCRGTINLPKRLRRPRR